jgi:hypothetical protein
MAEIFPALPDHVDRLDPRTLAWRLDRIEKRLSEIEDKSSFTQIAHTELQTPLGKLPLPLVLFGLLFLAYLNPEKAWRLIGL